MGSSCQMLGVESSSGIRSGAVLRRADEALPPQHANTARAGDPGVCPHEICGALRIDAYFATASAW